MNLIALEAPTTHLSEPLSLGISYVKEAFQKGWYAHYKTKLQELSSTQDSFWDLIEKIVHNQESDAHPTTLAWLKAFTFAIHPDLEVNFKAEQIKIFLSGDNIFSSQILLEHPFILFNLFPFLSEQSFENVIESAFNDPLIKAEENMVVWIFEILTSPLSSASKGAILEKLILSIPASKQDEALFYFKFNASREIQAEYLASSALLRSFDETLNHEILNLCQRMVTFKRDFVSFGGTYQRRSWKRKYLLKTFLQTHFQHSHAIFGLSLFEKEDQSFIIHSLKELELNLLPIFSHWLRDIFNFRRGQLLPHHQDLSRNVNLVLALMEHEKLLPEFLSSDYDFLADCYDAKSLSEDLDSQTPPLYRKAIVMRLIQCRPEEVIKWFELNIQKPENKEIYCCLKHWSDQNRVLGDELKTFFFNSKHNSPVNMLHWFIALSFEEQKLLLKELTPALLKEWILLCLPSNKEIRSEIKHFFVMTFSHHLDDLNLEPNNFGAFESQSLSEGDAAFLKAFVNNSNDFSTPEKREQFAFKLLNFHFAEEGIGEDTRQAFFNQVRNLYFKEHENQLQNLIDRLFQKIDRYFRGRIVLYLFSSKEVIFSKDSQKNIHYIIETYKNLLKAKTKKSQEITLLLRPALFTMLNPWGKERWFEPVRLLLTTFLELEPSHRYFFRFLECLGAKSWQEAFFNQISSLLDQKLGDQKIHYLAKALVFGKVESTRVIGQLIAKQKLLTLVTEITQIGKARGVYFFFDTYRKTHQRMNLLGLEDEKGKDFLDKMFNKWWHEIHLLDETLEKKFCMFQTMAITLLKQKVDVFGKIQRMNPIDKNLLSQWYKSKEVMTKALTIDQSALLLLKFFDPKKLEKRLYQRFWALTKHEPAKILTTIDQCLSQVEAVGQGNQFLDFVLQNDRLNKQILEGLKQNVLEEFIHRPSALMKILSALKIDWRAAVKEGIKAETQKQESSDAQLSWNKISFFMNVFEKLNVLGVLEPIFDSLLNEANPHESCLLQNIWREYEASVRRIEKLECRQS